MRPLAPLLVCLLPLAGCGVEQNTHKPMRDAAHPCDTRAIDSQGGRLTASVTAIAQAANLGNTPLLTWKPASSDPAAVLVIGLQHQRPGAPATPTGTVLHLEPQGSQTTDIVGVSLQSGSERLEIPAVLVNSGKLFNHSYADVLVVSNSPLMTAFLGATARETDLTATVKHAAGSSQTYRFKGVAVEERESLLRNLESALLSADTRVCLTGKTKTAG